MNGYYITFLCILSDPNNSFHKFCELSSIALFTFELPCFHSRLATEFPNNPSMSKKLFALNLMHLIKLAQILINLHKQIRDAFFQNTIWRSQQTVTDRKFYLTLSPLGKSIYRAHHFAWKNGEPNSSEPTFRTILQENNCWIFRPIRTRETSL